MVYSGIHHDSALVTRQQKGKWMSGRSRLPGGNPRKASQRHAHRAAQAPTVVVPAPTWRPGDRVRWKDYTGQYLRETIDGQAELLIGTRTYRVAAGELRSA
jgi:hypothetical protein